jgi:hypothetical protein
MVLPGRGVDRKMGGCPTLLRMISGARYSGVPHRVQVRPFTRFAKPKSVIWTGEKIFHYMGSKISSTGMEKTKYFTDTKSSIIEVKQVV